MAALLLVFAFTVMRDVLTEFIQDDAFYYFETTRHLGSGGAIFDGINAMGGSIPCAGRHITASAHECIVRGGCPGGRSFVVLEGPALT